MDVALTFMPPDRRRRDLDGMLGAFKAGLDSLSDVLGVDDSNFRLSLKKGDVIKGGAVVATIEVIL
jgi:crossover junction endodeoxyribonuclease RusA